MPHTTSDLALDMQVANNEVNENKQGGVIVQSLMENHGIGLKIVLIYMRHYLLIASFHTQLSLSSPSHRQHLPRHYLLMA